MRSVGVNTNIPATKGLAELNYHSRDELKGVRNGAGLDGHGLSEEDESQINELVQPHGAPRRPHQQPQGPVVQWERFLPLRSLKVLLVENDDSTRHVVSALLRNCSYEVTAVSNGLEAWKVLIDLNKQIDLVLTEVIMPYLSGTDLLSKITNHMTRKNTPVIMMSSDDSMGIVFNCLSKGAVDFLVKPIRKNELKNLWQHVWRKCHSSSGSGSESGIRAHKSAKSRGNEGSDEDNDISYEDDDTSIGLNAKGGSDNGSGTQNSWPKRVVKVNSSQAKSLWDKLPNSRNNTCPDVARPETSKNYWPTGAATRDHVIENNNNNNNKLEVVEMGKDLEIGMPKSSSFEMKTVNKKVTEKLCESNGDKLDIGQLHLGCENGAPKTETAKTNDAHMEAIPKAHDLIKNINNKDKSIYYNKAINMESPALELSLKRPRDTEDVEASGQERNVLRHSDLSPFSRYNTISNPNQAPAGNVGSCSPLGISSEAVKPDSIRSNSNRTPNQQSNGSNDMGSTTNNAFTKPDATTDPKTGPNGSTTAVHHTHTTTPLHPLVPCALDHYHTHHPHVHKQQKANGDDGSMRNMVSNVLTASAEGSAANYGIGSGSNNNKSNGEKCSSENSKIAGDNGVDGKCVARDGSGSRSGRGSGVDQERLAQREVALNKFRQKRKERCFKKKVRYQSRKKLAEQRPRVRGQFVRHGTNGINNEDADS